MKDAYTLIVEAIDNGIYKPGNRLVESNSPTVSASRGPRFARPCNGWKRNPWSSATAAA